MAVQTTLAPNRTDSGEPVTEKSASVLPEQGELMSRKNLIRACAVAVALTVSSPAAARPWKAPAGGHTAEEYRRNAGHWEMAYLALTVVDTAQTIDCLHRHRCHELNPLIGQNPSTGKLVGMRAAFDLVHYGTFRFLNDRNPVFARSFAIGSTLIEGSVVGINARLMF